MWTTYLSTYQKRSKGKAKAKLREANLDNVAAFILMIMTPQHYFKKYQFYLYKEKNLQS